MGMDHVIKHSSVVQMAADLTLNQRRSYNVMLANAFPNLSVQDSHTISIADLLRAIGSNTDNFRYAREFLLDMYRKDVVFNLFDRDKEHAEMWRVHSHLFADLAFHGNLVEYSYSPKLRKYIASPNFYIKLHLSIQQKFNCQYTIPIYEFLLDMLGAKRDYCTVKLTVGDFKNMNSVQDITLYEQFKYVNSRILKPALKEINAHSEISVGSELIKKGGNRVTDIKFTVKRNNLVKLDSVQTTCTPLQQEMVNYFNVPPSTASNWIKKHPEEDIRKAIQYVKDRVGKKKPIERKQMNLGGYLRTVLEQGYVKNDPLIQSRKQKQLQKEFIEKRLQRTAVLYAELNEEQQQIHWEKFIKNLSVQYLVDYEIDPNIETNPRLKDGYLSFLSDILLRDPTDLSFEEFQKQQADAELR